MFLPGMRLLPPRAGMTAKRLTAAPHAARLLPDPARNQTCLRARAASVPHCNKLRQQENHQGKNPARDSKAASAPEYNAHLRQYPQPAKHQKPRDESALSWPAASAPHTNARQTRPPPDDQANTGVILAATNRISQPTAGAVEESHPALTTGKVQAPPEYP